MNLPVLVLEPDSFLGSAVLGRLTANGWNARGHDGRGALATALQECGAVVDCAMGSARRLDTHSIALCAALQATGAERRVVQLSSMSVYGGRSGVVDESAPLRADPGDYAAARIRAEQRLRAVRPDAVILRPGIEYGPGGWLWTDRIARLLLQRRLGDLGAAGDGCCNLVHVQDVAQAVERALQLEAARGLEFNLALPAPPSWNEYLMRFAIALRAVPVRRVTARRLRLETRLLAVPLKILEIAAGRLGIAPAALPPAIPPSLLHLCRQELRLQVQRAETVLGLRWSDLDAGLRQSAAPYLSSSSGAEPI